MSVHHQLAHWGAIGMVHRIVEISNVTSLRSSQVASVKAGDLLQDPKFSIKYSVCTLRKRSDGKRPEERSSIRLEADIASGIEQRNALKGMHKQMTQTAALVLSRRKRINKPATLNIVIG